MGPINVLGVIGLLVLMLYIDCDMPPAIERHGKSLILRYSRKTRSAGLLTTNALPLSITLASFMQPPLDERGKWVYISMISLFAVLGGIAAVGSSGFAVVITDRGLEFRSGFRGPRFVPWDDVADLSYLRPEDYLLARLLIALDGRANVPVSGDESRNGFILRTRRGY